MIPDRNDEQLLDRMVDALRAQPIPKGPPDEVRQRVLALGESNLPETSVNAPSHWTWLADWIGTATAAAALLAVVDLSWWMYVNSTKPVGWFRDRSTDTWHVMYDNTRVEIHSRSAELHKDA